MQLCHTTQCHRCLMFWGSVQLAYWLQTVQQCYCQRIECWFLYHKPPPTSCYRIWQYVQPASQLQTTCMALYGRAVCWCQHCEQGAPWWRRSYCMVRHKLRTTNTIAFIDGILNAQRSVTRSWGPLSCHSSVAITSYFSSIMHRPISQASVQKLKMSQFFHGLYTHQTCPPLSMFGMLWIDVYDSGFQFPPYPATFPCHWRGVGQQSSACERDVSRCMRQMVVTPDTDWFSDPRPYLFFLKVSVTNRCISVFPVKWNP